MVKVSSSSRHNVHKALDAYEFKHDLGDIDIDNLVRGIRTELGKTRPSSIGEETQVMMRALLPVRDYLLPMAADAMDVDSWGGLMWDMYIAATNHTKSAMACNEIASSEANWADLMVLIMAAPSKQEYEIHAPFWWKRVTLALGLALMGVFMVALPTMLGSIGLELSGRLKVIDLFGGTLLLGAAEVWRRYGKDLKTMNVLKTKPLTVGFRDADAVSVASSSSRLREERDRLQEDLDKARGEVARAREQADPSPDLMKSMASLAANKQADETTKGAEATPSSRPFYVGDVVQIDQCLLSAGAKRGAVGVVLSKHVNETLNIGFPDGTNTNFVPAGHVSLSCLPSGASLETTQWFKRRSRRSPGNC